MTDMTQSTILNVTLFLTDLLTCKEMNPNKVFCYFNVEGMIHAYCKSLSNVHRAESMDIISECNVTIRRRESFTNVTFISQLDYITPLQVQFRF